jgi:hypothetical protein
MTITSVEVTVPVVAVEIQDSANVISMATPDLSIVEIITAATPVRVEVLQPTQYLEVIDNAIRGEPGPTGPAGLVKVTHGSNPDVLRPDAPLVYWVGSVQPVNADPDDLLMFKEA